MKKSKKFLWGMLAALLTFGLVLAGCEDIGVGLTANYSVSYDPGAGSGTPPSDRTVAAGTTITLPGKGSMTAPTGQQFNGWKTGGITYSVGDSYVVNGDVTFTAQWGDNSGVGPTTNYSVSYDPGAGSGTPPSDRTVAAGTTITLPGKGSMTAPTGQQFNGWETGGITYSVGDSYVVNGDVTFTAQWGDNSGVGPTTNYSVSYDPGAGSGTPPSDRTVAAGTTITLPGKGSMTAPTGQQFNGWETGGITYSVGDSYVVNGDVTFTAQWGDNSGVGPTTNYSVSYDPGAGSGTPPSDRTVAAGTTITLPGKGSMTAPTGQQFNGWETGGITYSVGDSYVVNGDVTFTAQWGDNSGGGDTAVTFSSANANGSSSQTTTELTLTFSQAITGLSTSDITLSGVSGVSKGTLSGSGPTYTLGISDFTSSGTLSVSVSKSGYTISGSPKTADIYYYSAPKLPSTPTGLTATISGSNITVSWNAASGATSYDVYKRDPASGTFEFKINITSRTWSDTSPHPGYNRYAVYSKNSVGQSPAYTMGQTSSEVPLATPTIDTISYGTSNNGHTTILVNPVNYATSYNVFWSTTASGTYTILAGASSTDMLGTKVNVQTALGTGISGTTLYFKVQAVYAPDSNTRVTSAQSASKSYKIP